MTSPQTAKAVPRSALRTSSRRNRTPTTAGRRQTHGLKRQARRTAVPMQRRLERRSKRAVHMRSSHVARGQAGSKRVKHHREQRLPVPHPGHLGVVWQSARNTAGWWCDAGWEMRTVSNARCVSFFSCSSCFHFMWRLFCSNCTASSTYLQFATITATLVAGLGSITACVEDVNVET